MSTPNHKRNNFGRLQEAASLGWQENWNSLMMAGVRAMPAESEIAVRALTMFYDDIHYCKINLPESHEQKWADFSIQAHRFVCFSDASVGTNFRGRIEYDGFTDLRRAVGSGRMMYIPEVGRLVFDASKALLMDSQNCLEELDVDEYYDVASEAAYSLNRFSVTACIRNAKPKRADQKTRDQEW